MKINNKIFKENLKKLNLNYENEIGNQENLGNNM